MTKRQLGQRGRDLGPVVQVVVYGLLGLFDKGEAEG